MFVLKMLRIRQVDFFNTICLKLPFVHGLPNGLTSS